MSVSLLIGPHFLLFLVFSLTDAGNNSIADRINLVSGHNLSIKLSRTIIQTINFRHKYFVFKRIALSEYQWVVKTSHSTCRVLHRDTVLNSRRNGIRLFCTAPILLGEHPSTLHCPRSISLRNIRLFWNRERNRIVEPCYRTCPWRCVQKTRLLFNFFFLLLITESRVSKHYL